MKKYECFFICMLFPPIGPVPNQHQNRFDDLLDQNLFTNKGKEQSGSVPLNTLMNKSGISKITDPDRAKVCDNIIWYCVVLQEFLLNIIIAVGIFTEFNFCAIVKLTIINPSVGGGLR